MKTTHHHSISRTSKALRFLDGGYVERSAGVFFSKWSIRIARLVLSSYIRSMKTLTVRLPDSLATRIEQESIARCVSKSDIVRERLGQLGSPPPKETVLREILETAWSAETPTRPRQLRSPNKQRLTEAIRAKKLHR